MEPAGLEIEAALVVIERRGRPPARSRTLHARWNQRAWLRCAAPAPRRRKSPTGGGAVGGRAASPPAGPESNPSRAMEPAGLAALRCPCPLPENVTAGRRGPA